MWQNVLIAKCLGVKISWIVCSGTISGWHNVWVAKCLVVKIYGCQNIGCQNVPVSKGYVPKCQRIYMSWEWPKASLLCGTQVTRVQIDGGVEQWSRVELHQPGSYCNTYFILDSFLDAFGILLEYYWTTFWILLGYFWDTFGTLLYIFLDTFSILFWNFWR